MTCHSPRSGGDPGPGSVKDKTRTSCERPKVSTLEERIESLFIFRVYHTDGRVKNDRRSSEPQVSGGSDGISPQEVGGGCRSVLPSSVGHDPHLHRGRDKRTPGPTSTPDPEYFIQTRNSSYLVGVIHPFYPGDPAVTLVSTPAPTWRRQNPRTRMWGGVGSLPSTRFSFFLPVDVRSGCDTTETRTGKGGTRTERTGDILLVRGRGGLSLLCTKFPTGKYFVYCLV